MTEDALSEIGMRAFATVPEDVLVGDLPEETVPLSTKTGEYYSLNEVAARAFALAQQSRTLDEVLATLLDEYEVEEDRLRADTRSLIKKLTSIGLLKLNDGNPS